MLLRIGKYLLLLLIFLSSEVDAQLAIRDSSINVTFYGVEDGLPNPEVTVIFRDSFGLIWLGTDGGGVSCFDAHSFFNYYPNRNIADSLSDGYVTCIAEDKAHNIWVGTQTGVSCLNRHTMKFQNYPIEYATRNGNYYRGVLAIYFDSYGQCWLGSMRGLGRFDTTTGEVEWLDFPFLLNEQHLYLTNKILEDKKGNLWILVSGVLLCWDRMQKEYMRLETSQYETGHTKPKVISGFAFDSKYRLCVSTHNAIYVYRDGVNLPYVYELPTLDQSNTFRLIEGLWLGYADELWCLVDNKLYFVERTTGEWLRIDKIFTRTDQLGYIPNAACNFEGENVYFFPVEGGFASWSHHQLFFSQDMLQLDYRAARYQKKVVGIYTSDDKEVWAGTNNGTIFRIDFLKDSVFLHTPDQQPPRNGISISSFYEFATGDFIGGTSKGPIYFDKAAKQWVSEPKTPWLSSLFHALKKKSINKIGALDSARYIFALQDGVLLYNKKTGRWDMLSTLRGKNVQDYIVLEDKNLLCIANQKAYRTHVGSSHITPIVFYDSASSTLFPPPSAICLAGHNGQCWIGTDVGLFLLHSGTDTCIRVTQHNYFKTHAINSMTCDVDGNVWLATERGIAEYDLTNQQLYFFGKSDGLYHTAFNRNSVYVSPQGQTYFGNQRGLTRFNPRTLRNYEGHKVLASKLEIAGQDMPNKELATLTTHTIRIPRGYTSLTFQLSQLNYASTQQPRFQVILEGLYDRWTDVVSGNTLNINNLPAGTFTLRYQASLNGEVWTEGIPYNLEIESNESLLDLLRRYLPIVTVLLLVLTIFFLRRNVHDRHGKFNERIRSTMSLEALNQELERQSRAVRAELRNARHSQDIILPTLENIRQRCPDSFVFFKPLREVSGDIYWYSEYMNYLYVGVIDCTGHGASAALMSLITYVFLHTIIVEYQTTSAARILELLSNSLYDLKVRKEGEEDLREGADLSFCVINTERHMIDFAGSFHRIIHRHGDQTDVYIGDATFIGQEHNQRYNSRLIHYSPSDFLYMFSDGYSDQLGGELAKKMRFSRFKEHIEAASRLPIHEQERYLQEALAKWQGANMQYDDITILGFQCTFREYIGTTQDRATQKTS